MDKEESPLYFPGYYSCHHGAYTLFGLYTANYLPSCDLLDKYKVPCFPATFHLGTDGRKIHGSRGGYSWQWKGQSFPGNEHFGNGSFRRSGYYDICARLKNGGIELSKQYEIATEKDTDYSGYGDPLSRVHC